MKIDVTQEKARMVFVRTSISNVRLEIVKIIESILKCVGEHTFVKPISITNNEVYSEALLHSITLDERDGYAVFMVQWGNDENDLIESCADELTTDDLSWICEKLIEETDENQKMKE